ncbi:elongation factor [Psychromonas ingrahamii 37]|uniref:Elongation factor n=1 Tax=Psychromonas ingrahamii (strain DSM 17664 / CCUG 51855 / 37) TaxID=357804 RepID=A1SRE9_PSYIN|nr:YigZ family protein [Psychromonas ingrahamii]ABM02064.1 elongation factor [Psychromonas ingrahamii 37]
MEPYFIPMENLFFQEEIKKSRFMTYVARIEGKEQALTYVHGIKKSHQAASHHCWAYIGAAPDNDMCMGRSDDGEPKGTAGKPILSTLQGSQIGEIIAVVVRYSGGIKLGTGGLVRAYSNGVQQLIKQLITTEKRFYQRYQLHCDYAQMAQIESLLVVLSGRIVEVDYLQSIQALIEVDQQLCQQFIEKLDSLTQGQVIAKKIPITVR